MSLLDPFRGGEKIPAFFNEHSPVGAVVHGPITDVQVRERTDFKTGDVLYFPDGKPKQQVVITIQTDIRDGAEDDGRRRIYVKMDYKSDREALLAAVDAAGDDDVRVGGQFAAQYKGYGVLADGKPAAWKVYQYEYRKPANLAGLLGDQTPDNVAAPVAQPVSPQQAETVRQDPAAAMAALRAKRAAAAAPAQPAPVDPATTQAIREAITDGFSDNEIAGAFPTVNRELIVALRNAAALAGA